ncbi:MAG: hypothetical protein AAGC60_28205 [Acidobacteriota bacterium]
MTHTAKLAILACSLLLAATIAIPASAAIEAPGIPSPTPQLTIADVEIDASDLFVTLFADPTDAGLGLEILIDVDGTGFTIATVSATVPGGGGRFDVLVPQITAAIPLHGYNYLVRARLPGGADVATPLAFRQRLRCPSEDACHVDAWPGVLTTERALTVPAELAEIVRGAGTTLDLRQLASARPSLRGDLYTVLDELDGSGGAGGTAVRSGGAQKGRASAHPGLPSGCLCAWLVGVEFGGLAREVSRVDDAVVLEPASSTSFADLSVDFVCFDPSQMTGRQIELPGTVFLDVYDLDDLALCLHDCPTAVEFEIRSTLGAAAGGGDSEPVFGAASLADGSARLDWIVDGQLTTLGTVDASFAHAPLDDPKPPTRDRVGIQQASQPYEAPTSASIRAILGADSWAASTRGWSHGEGAVSTTTRLRATMTTSCLVHKATDTTDVEPFLRHCCKDYVSLLDGNP